MQDNSQLNQPSKIVSSYLFCFMNLLLSFSHWKEALTLETPYPWTYVSLLHLSGSFASHQEDTTTVKSLYDRLFSGF